MDVLQIIQDASWNADYEDSLKRRAISGLEGGKIVFFPTLAFELKPEELPLLSPAFSDGKSKNISFDMRKGVLGGVVGSPKEQEHLKNMLQRFSVQATTLVRQLFPAYSDHLQVGRTSYRPVEILGRKSASYKKDDTRLHVDAFPASPNQGRRILRVFSNINPHGQPRLWRVGEPFDQVARQFLPRVTKPVVSGWLLKQLGITKSLRTHYDHIMLQIHDRMKADVAYQAKADQQELRLPAGSTWIVKTDVVSHAAMSGQFLMEQTFYLPVQAMEDEGASPLRILEKLTQKRLV